VLLLIDLLGGASRNFRRVQVPTKSAKSSVLAECVGARPGGVRVLPGNIAAVTHVFMAVVSGAAGAAGATVPDFFMICPTPMV
jgi:hypothetical protein